MPPWCPKKMEFFNFELEQKLYHILMQNFIAIQMAMVSKPENL